MTDDAQTGQEGQNQTPASQQSGTGEPDGSVETVTRDVMNAEVKKVVDQRQSQKQRADAAEQLAAELNGKLAKMPTQGDLELLEQVKTERAEQAKTKALKEGDVDSIVEQARRPLLQKIEGLEGGLEQRNAQITAFLCDTSLRKAAELLGAINPEQVVRLLRPQVKMEEQPGGNYEPSFMDASGQPLYDEDGKVTDVKKFVGRFLGDPANANLVKSQANPGSGAQQAGGGNTPDGIPTTLDQFNAIDDPAKKMEAARKMTQDQRNSLVGIEKPEAGGFI